MMDPRHDHKGFQMPQMAAPPLMNPPPQIFGAYSVDGLSNMNLPDLSQQPIFGDGTLMDESLEAKRRRIARVGLRAIYSTVQDMLTALQACDMCRKKKIKCDGKLPACTHCINYKTECVFTQVEKKRNPPKGYTRPQLHLQIVADFVKVRNISRGSRTD
jgi:hypothetical protein